MAFRPMDMGKIGEIRLEAPSGILGLIAKRMEWLGTRQTLIAQNIANSDTPNFTPKDLTEKSFAQALRASKGSAAAPTMTHEAHLAPLAASGGSQGENRRDLFEVSPAGNAVVLEQELLKMSEVQTQHSLMVNLYRKHLTMMKSVLKGR